MRFQFVQRLSRGAYGKVDQYYDCEKAINVAIKKPLKETDTEKEIDLLRFLQHENIVTLLDVVQEWMVFELLDADLQDLLLGGPLNQPLADSYLRQLLLGLDYLHGKNIIHRDLKPQNLLIDQEGKLKICDFGMATYATEKRRRSCVCTRPYRAPELLLGRQTYGTEIDMWSVGCILGEMITGRPLFMGRTDHHQLILIFTNIPACRKALPELFDQFDPPTSSLPKNLILSEFLQCDAKRRISAKLALKHEYWTAERLRSVGIVL